MRGAECGTPACTHSDCMDPEELAILAAEGGQRSGNQLRAVNAIADVNDPRSAMSPSILCRFCSIVDNS